MLLKDLSDAIAGNFNHQLDTEFRRRVEDLIILARAELIRRNVDKYGSNNSNSIMQINCIPTIQVDKAECCSVELGCNITRTKDTVPSPIRIRGRGSNYIYVGTIDGRKSYAYMDAEETDLLAGERFIGNGISYSYINNYIYIHHDNPQNIRVKLIPNDPREVANLNDCENEQDCIDNIEIDNDLGTLIIDFVSNQLRRTEVEEEQIEVKLEED